MSGIQISSKKSPETYLKDLKDEYESIMTRDNVDELSKKQWNEIVESMKSKGHSGSLEAWKKLWEENMDSLTINRYNINKIIEEELEDIEVSESPDIFDTIDDSEELEKELKKIDTMEIEDLLEEYLKKPKPQDSDRKKRDLERLLDQTFQEIESGNKKPILPKTRSREDVSKKVAEKLF
tara:strand:- start:4025 stop:4564 length:540 start_codon:yes stop_codon:yes gene_type:complete